MKDNSQITSYLNEYLNMENPHFAVMITGKWGCGKTYYIKNLINKWSNFNEKDSKESIVLEPIYISLNGLNSIGSIVHKIKSFIYPLLYSKSLTVAKQIVFTALKIMVKSQVDLDRDGSGEDMDKLLDAEGIINLFKSESSSIRGNKILVLDDVERCKIPVDELFGFLNNLIEHSNSKVILICDESKLNNDTDKANKAITYKDIKEKLVGQTFSLESDYEKVANSFIDAKQNNILIANKKLIVELFSASGLENLRLFRHCLIDIIRLLEQLPKEIEKKPSYNLFLTNVVAYLAITSLEVRFGNPNIDFFQSFSLADKDKQASKEFEQKYNGVLEKFGIYNAYYTLPLKYLVEFIRTGFLTPQGIAAIINCNMLQSKNLKNWEKLWHYYGLSNENFLEILSVEKRRFYGKTLEYVFEVVHIAGILLSLEKNGLVKLSRQNIVKTAKSTIASINKTNYQNISKIILSNQKYEFKEYNSLEMKDIMSYAQDLFKRSVTKMENEYIKKIWSEIGQDTTQNWLMDKLRESTPDRRCSYSMISIFKQIPPRKMVDKIIAMPNSVKIEFSSFLIDRYYLKGAFTTGQLGNEIKEDKDHLSKISLLLKSKAKGVKLIDKCMLLHLSEKIDEAVLKM